MMKLLATAAYALLLPLLMAAPALAEEPADSRSTAFQAMQGAAQEDVPGGSLLIYAYGFVLCLLIAYLARIGRMQAKTTTDLARLTQALDRAGKKS